MSSQPTSPGSTQWTSHPSVTRMMMTSVCITGHRCIMNQQDFWLALLKLATYIARLQARLACWASQPSTSCCYMYIWACQALGWRLCTVLAKLVSHSPVRAPSSCRCTTAGLNFHATIYLSVAMKRCSEWSEREIIVEVECQIMSNKEPAKLKSPNDIFMVF